MKLRVRSQLAVDAARALIAELGIRGARDLRDVEAIAAEKRAYVLWSDLAGNEEGHILHAGRSSVIRVRKSLRGTSKGRFVTAHEIGHHDLHAHVDHYPECTSEGLAAGGSRWRVEREASDYGSELLVPTRFADAMCRGATVPTIDDVLAVASEFDVSFTVAALRFLEMTDAACAFVETRAGKVKRGSATAGFRGEGTRGHALAVPRDARAWSLPVEGTDVELTWVSQS